MSQLSDPFNVNFITNGIEPIPNGQWTKTLSVDTKISDPLKQNWSSITCSSDGKFVMACVNGGKIYASSNYGYDMVSDSSSILPGSASWTCVSISPNGQYAVACAINDGVYLATLSGTTWTWKLITIFEYIPRAMWTCVSFSGDNTSIAACIGGGGGIYFSDDLGYSWTYAGNPKDIWYSITYVGNDPTKKQFAASSNVGIYIWSYYQPSGNPTPYPTWKPSTPTQIANCSSISGNASGGNIFACNNNRIYKGQNYGSNWFQTSAPTANWSSIASSSNGQYIVACINGGGVYCSIDYGNSWKEQVNGVSSLSWKCVATASNSSGSFLVGCAQNDYIYISPYFQGFQWKSANTINSWWHSLASDSTGKNLIAGIIYDDGNGTGGVSISQDYGLTWSNPQSLFSGYDIPNVASNGDGSKLGVIVAGNTYIITYSVPTPTNAVSYIDNLQTLETSDTANCSQISFDKTGNYAAISSYYINNAPGTNDPTHSGRLYLGFNLTSDNTYTWKRQTIEPPPSTTSLYSWVAIKFSGDGKKIFACSESPYDFNANGIWVGNYNQSDNTANFSKIYTNDNLTSEIYFKGITCSYDGSYVAGFSIGKKNTTDNTYYSKVWISKDSGLNFQNPSSLPTTVTAENYGFQGITMDKTGQKLATVYYDVAVGTARVFTSFDYGVNWITQEKDLPTTYNGWKSIASNENMDKLILCAFAPPYGASVGIFTAFLSETSWTPQLNAVPTRNYFTKLASSSSGQYLAAAAANQTSDDPNTNNNYGGIWISTDAGTTWIKSNAGNFRWDAIASDNTGQYLVAGVYGGQIYTSSNYGLSWTIQSSSCGLPESANWDAISFSCNSDPTSTSQYVYAQNYYVPDVSDGYVYYSTDRGISWIRSNGAAPWGNGIGSTSDGQYAYYGVNNPTVPGPYGIYNTSQYGTDNSFALTYNVAGNWNYVATDPIGEYVAAVNTYTGTGSDIENSVTKYGIYFSLISSFYGISSVLSQRQNWRSITLVITETNLLIKAVCVNGLIYSGTVTLEPSNLVGYSIIWTLNSATTSNGNLPASEWNDIKSSSDGKRLVICSTNGGIWTSADSGVTWSQSTLSNTYYRTAITNSSTGQNLAAILNNGPIYISSNYGLNWSPLTVNGLPSYTTWYSIASSITGQYIVASTIVGDIYISDNYGNSWSKSIIGLNSLLSISSSGQYIVAATTSSIYISSNFGSTWRQLTIANGLPSLTELWSSISISNSGQYIVAAINGGTIYSSSNFGSTWRQINATAAKWSSISISGSGQNIVATINGGTIYSSSNFGSTWIQLTTANGLPSLTEDWSSISISGTGQNIVATINGGAIYSSSDFGSTWRQANTTATNWNAITSSTSGQYLAAINSNNNDQNDIYIYSNSMDIGNIWGSLINELQILITKL